MRLLYDTARAEVGAVWASVHSGVAECLEDERPVLHYALRERVPPWRKLLEMQLQLPLSPIKLASELRMPFRPDGTLATPWLYHFLF